MSEQVGFRELIVDGLLKASRLVYQVTNGQISWSNFLRDYNDFYLYYGLQGDEFPPEKQCILAEYPQEIKFHERVQFEILALLFDAPPDQRPQYLAAGRIDAVEALSRLTRLAQESQLDEMIDRLNLELRRTRSK